MVSGAMSHSDAYHRIPYEVLANVAETKLRTFLSTHAETRTKLINGEVVTKADWREIEKYKVFREGLQFIDGFLVYVSPKK
jgi:hypothetical protein